MRYMVFKFWTLTEEQTYIPENHTIYWLYIYLQMKGSFTGRTLTLHFYKAAYVFQPMGVC